MFVLIRQFNCFFSLISSLYQKADNEANLFACGIELGACLIFCFPLFICHPCVFTAIDDGRRSEILRDLNRQFYGGRPALSTTQDGGLLINTDFMASNVQNMVYVQQPTEHPVQPSVYSISPTAIAVPYTPIAVPRTVQVAVPAGLGPGSAFQVVTPDGQKLNVQNLVIKISFPTFNRCVYCASLGDRSSKCQSWPADYHLVLIRANRSYLVDISM